MNGLLSELRSRFKNSSHVWTLFAFALIANIVPTSVHAQATSTVPVAPVSLVADSAFNPEAYGLAAAYAISPRSKKELYAWNANKSWPIASLTKLVSSLVWKDRAVPWTRVVTLLSKDEVGGGRLRVPVGSKVTFEDLFYSSITASANNAAMAVARSLGVSQKQFLVLMKKQAELAGAKAAVFADPTGMDPGNVASAKEMALIAYRAFSWRPIQRAASTNNYVVELQGKKVKAHPIYTTNDLLRYDPDVWVIAGKTGYLEESRYNLVVWMRPVGVDGKPITSKDEDVLIVIFGAPTKQQMFGAAKALAQSLWNSDATLQTHPNAR